MLLILGNIIAFIASVLMVFTGIIKEKSKIILITNKGHMRVTDIAKFFITNRLGKVQTILQSFKGDPHSIVSAFKVKKDEEFAATLYLNDRTSKRISVSDLRNTEAQYAKKNIDGLTLKQHVTFVFDTNVSSIGKDNISHPILVKEPKGSTEVESAVEAEVEEDSKEKADVSFEQISIFDDLD